MAHTARSSTMVDSLTKMTLRLLSVLLWIAVVTASYARTSHNYSPARDDLWSYAKSLHGGLRGLARRLQSREYRLWPSSEIHATLLQWKTQYPNLARITTSQEAYGLPAAGDASDCPFDQGDGCLNYVLTIQDFVVHPEGSSSSNGLAEVFWSGALHGNERVGPTAVMEAAFLLLEAAQCESKLLSDQSSHGVCSAALLNEYGIDSTQRQWLARLVSTRRIVIVPTANALGYYQGIREEGGVDVNRDFPFDYTTGAACMLSIGGRTLNEVFREHMFQMALTFHGGVELIGYEWGATSYSGVLSPDDVGQNRIAASLSTFGGSWLWSSNYLIGPMDQVIYTVQGGMEDWAYAGSWIPEKVIPCEPTTYGGYPMEKTIYNNSTLRAFNMLVETSSTKIPEDDTLGTTENVLSKDTSGNGHVSRNIRVALLSAHLVEPYLSFVAVDDMALPPDMVPLTTRDCQSANSVEVAANLTEVIVEWTVGGALEIDDTKLWYGNWYDVADGVDCLSQPLSTVTSSMVPGYILTEPTGIGYFSPLGPSPPPAGETLGPVFRASVDLSSFSPGDKVVILVSARVDESWIQQPEGIAPETAPQSHIVQARTNPNWYHQSNGRTIQGLSYWYSVIPLTLRIGESNAGTPKSLAPSSSTPPEPPTPSGSSTPEADTPTGLAPSTPSEPSTPSGSPTPEAGITSSASFAHIASLKWLVLIPVALALSSSSQ